MRLVLVLVLLGAAPSPTERVSNDKPVEMSAKSGLEIDLKRNVGMARGDVVIKREDVLVCCDEAEAKFSGDQIERVECRGRVVIVRPDGTKAIADVAVFEAKSERVTLSGKARVRSKSTDMSGETIVYDIATDQLNVSGKKSRFRFKPIGDPLVLPRACPPPP